ncbi:UNVERIFIED_CONTAM: VQ motif-containing protein 25 [Sesamum radiatum]|uniref:VQ motif-containing protein 25 n=1 Tax=Sesamum radiatum TaxID=300843 RepID=A0AAW2TJ60_SESRA
MYMKTERFMEKQTRTPNTALSPLPMHKNSHTISKSKPKIRIIHIFAPEIIKTDAANFRELVQRLTGKPTADDRRNMNCCPKTSRILRKKEQRVSSSSNKKMEVSWRGGDGVMGERIKGEEEIWRAANSGRRVLGWFC